MNNAKKTMLVVDDVELNRAIFSECFDDLYNIIEAKNGYEALSILDKPNSVAIIIVDLVMPELDGYGLIKQLKQNSATAKIPIVVITAFGDAESEQKALELGAWDFLRKPIDIDSARVRINHVVNKNEC